MEARLRAESPDGKHVSNLMLRFAEGGIRIERQELADGSSQAPAPLTEVAFGRVLELRVSLAALGMPSGEGLKFQLSLWQGGLPVDAVPQQGWLILRTTDALQASV